MAKRLRAVIDRIFCKLAPGHFYRTEAYTLQSACEIKKDGVEVMIGRDQYNQLYTQIKWQDDRIEDVDSSAIRAKAYSIDQIAFAKSTYGKIKNTPLFHELYGVAPCNFSFKKNDSVDAEEMLSAPCMECGIVLPLGWLTVDHQRPQTGGINEAVAKTFRAFGLTLGAPQGPKGQAILNHLFHGEDIAPIPTRNSRPPLTSTYHALADRYTLNNEGMVLYSLVKGENCLGDLQNDCMHGLCNLRPMCFRCNSRRGNPLKF